MQRPIDNLAFIFHIGLYSYFGFDDIQSARRRKIQNGSEWYLERLQDKSYRPISGSQETKLYHKNFGENFDYFRAPLCLTRECISNWLDLCVKCRASNVIITARHHDGFCLWPTNTTSNRYTIDIILIFKEEAKRRGLKFGIYYSWFEFLQPFTVDYYRNIAQQQVLELLNYTPDMFWFDGDWKITQKSVKSEIRNLLMYIYSLQQYGITILVNDRICKENIDLSSFRVFDDRFIPNQPISNWQHINTIGLSWGYNKTQHASDYKNGGQLFSLYQTVTSLGGYTCFNIGPKYDGTLDENEEQSLNEFSLIINSV